MDTKELWRLIGESGLAPPERWEQLRSQFAGVTGSGQQANGAALAEWLLGQKAITRYQAKILLAGKSGPFIYGDYVVRERLTSGRLSGLFRATHAGTGHSVLLKFLTGEVVKDATLYRAAAAQVAAGARAVDPCLMQVYQLADLGSFKFIVVEDLEGAPSDEALAARKRLSAPVACRLMRQAALGAGALHTAGLAHGEIRPRNVWIDAQGHAKLLQTPVSREPQLAAPTMHGGDLAAEQLAAAADYFAPEMARPGQSADVLTDVYALGCTLYELLSGRPPFAGGGAATKMQRHAREAIAPLAAMGVPEALVKVIAFAMAKDRRVRTLSAAAFAEALTPFVDAGKVKLMPQRAATHAAFEAWRQSQPIVPQGVLAMGGSDPVGGMATPSANGMPDQPTAAGIGVEAIESQVGFTLADPGAPGGYQMADASGYQFSAPGVKSPAFAALERRRRQQRMNALITVAVLLISGLGVGIAYLAYFRDWPNSTAIAEGEGATQPSRDDRATREEVEKSIESGEGADGERGASKTTTAAADDGKMLWAAPAAGGPIELAYLPPSVDLVVHLRPAELVKHAEAEKLIAALGPYGQRVRAALEAATALKLVEMERLTVGWAADEPAAVTLIVRPVLVSQTEAVIGKWQSYQQRPVGSEQLYSNVSDGWTYFAPVSEEKNMFVVSSSKNVDQIASAGSGSAPPKLDLVKVAATSDASRMVTVLFTTSAVFAEGGSLFGGLGQLQSAAEWFFADARSAALSLHLLPQAVYLEARLVSGVETTPSELAERYRDRLQEMTGGVRAHLRELELHQHGRAILFQFPMMVSFLQEHARVGVDAEQVVLNSYLPAVAAHNLVMGAELALSETGRGAGDAAAVAVTPSGGSSAAEKLEKATSLMVTAQPFEGVLQQIGQEIGLPTEVVGPAFQEAGITRVQSITVALQNKPAGEILRAVMLKANPDGKLVYVFQKNTAGEESLVITTRAMAAKVGQKLPPEFATAEAKQKK